MACMHASGANQLGTALRRLVGDADVGGGHPTQPDAEMGLGQSHVDADGWPTNDEFVRASVALRQEPSFTTAETAYRALLATHLLIEGERISKGSSALDATLTYMFAFSSHAALHRSFPLAGHSHLVDPASRICEFALERGLDGIVVDHE